jgi:hypothetical protein
MSEGFRSGIGRGLQLSSSGKLVLAPQEPVSQEAKPLTAAAPQKVYIPTPTPVAAGKPVVSKKHKRTSRRLPKKLILTPVLLLIMSGAGVAYGLPLLKEDTSDAQYKTLSTGTAAVKIPQPHVVKAKKAATPTPTPAAPAVSKPTTTTPTAKKVVTPSKPVTTPPTTDQTSQGTTTQPDNTPPANQPPVDTPVDTGTGTGTGDPTPPADTPEEPIVP